jgi:hypothetical protein
VPFNPVTHNSSGTCHEDSLSIAIACLRQGHFAQAYAVLSVSRFEKEPAALFALGLCHLHAEEYPASIDCFKKAELLLRVSSRQEMPPANETYFRLAVKQIEQKVYLKPMDTDYCARFPKTAAQTVLMAMIYTYQKSGMPEQVRRLAAGLTGAEFARYKEKMLEGLDDASL